MRRGTERDLEVATELLLMMHNEVSAGGGGDFAYGGSPAQRRVLEFLKKRGKSVVTVKP